jgi:nucleoside-diphosphate-sugar epimerase
VILVTGATGFIGRAVVARLLAAGAPVAVLARGRDGLDARARVETALGAGAAGRVAVVEGDLTGDGLAPADRRRLRAAVDTVIHCAGDPSFAPAAPAPFTAGHVDGPVALLRALAGDRLARWAHLSTAFVCGDRTGVVREADGERGQGFHNLYERVKLQAEAAVRAAGRETGVDVRVLRPSIVVGPAPPTAGGGPSNLVFAFIRLLGALARWPGGVGRLRIEAAPRAPFNIVPLEYVAEATVALATAPAAAGGTFHLVVRDAPSQAAMLAMLVERLEVTGLTLVDAATERLTAPSPLERRVARMLEPYRAYLTQHVIFDDAAAAAELGRAGVARPSLRPAEVHRLIDVACGARTPALETAP